MIEPQNERYTKIKQAEKKIYVLGHRNPDTDSIVAAAAYAALKRVQGAANCVAARAGKATPQTEYIFSRFNAPLPEFLPDLVPKVGYYYNPRIRTITDDISLWEAMSLLQNNETRALPVVDAAGRYHSLLHYSFFAQRLLKISNPQQKTAIQTSIELLASVLHAQPLVMADERAVRKSPILVAASRLESFRRILEAHVPENTIVIAGDREDVLQCAIESGVRALVITSGNTISRELRESAERRGVSVLISPYDTSSTTLLLIYSMPASCMSNADLKPVRRTDTIRKVAPLLSNAPGKSLPVVDDLGVVVGVISESDLYQEPNVEIIMVDHNEPSQAIEGVENYKILEIIDHHRLGNLTTKYPITFINKPVGATSTIVATLYRESRVPLPRDIASILLCGILADTLALQSATTTITDRETAEFLANITGLDLAALGGEVMAAASNVSGRSAMELIHQDMKDYREGKFSFAVSQIEVGAPGEVLTRKDEFIAALEAERAKGGHLFCAVLVTDITALSSHLLIAAEPRFRQYIALPRLEESVYIMRDVVSRKKQLMPILSELVEKYLAG